MDLEQLRANSCVPMEVMNFILSLMNWIFAEFNDNQDLELQLFSQNLVLNSPPINW